MTELAAYGRRTKNVPAAAAMPNRPPGLPLGNINAENPRIASCIPTAISPGWCTRPQVVRPNHEGDLFSDRGSRIPSRWHKLHAHHRAAPPLS